VAFFILLCGSCFRFFCVSVTSLFPDIYLLSADNITNGTTHWIVGKYILMCFLKILFLFIFLIWCLSISLCIIVSFVIKLIRNKKKPKQPTVMVVTKHNNTNHSFGKPQTAKSRSWLGTGKTWWQSTAG
jgi:predicted membrane protein